MAEAKVVYYTDELNDDFAENTIKQCEVKKDFPFAPTSPLWCVLEWIAYYLIAIPLVHLFCFCFCGFRVKNRSAIRRLKKKHKGGYFIYANHTHFTDAFVGPIVSFPYKAHIIANPDAVSIKGLRTFEQLIGCIPLPTDLSGMPGFMRAVKTRLDQGRGITIYPEAHIWPYCNFVRDFKAASFKYPCKWNCPVIAVAVTYQRRRGVFRFIKKPKRTLFVSEPFYIDSSLSVHEASEKLRNEVHSFLDETCKTYSDYAYIKYVKRDAEQGSEREKAL